MAQTYLSNHHMERFISEFEENLTHKSLELVVAALLCYAFDSDEKWAMNYKAATNGGGSYYFAMQLDGGQKILHTIIKIVSTDEPISEDWDTTLAPLAAAPLPNQRCWALLFQGMTMKLFEYHRDQPQGARLLICDFKVDGKMTDTLHIRDNCRVVNSVLFQIPDQSPLPLSDDFLQLQAKALAIKTAQAKPADDKIPDIQYERKETPVETQPMSSAPAGVKPAALVVKTNTHSQAMPKVRTARPIAQSTAQPTVKPSASPALKPTPSPAVKPAAGPAFDPGASSTFKLAVSPANYAAFKATAHSALKPGAPDFKPATISPLKPGTPTFQPNACGGPKNGSFKANSPPATKTSIQPALNPAAKTTVNPAMKLNIQPKAQAAATQTPDVDLMSFADLDVGTQTKINGRVAQRPG
ncbi:hypothetical protein PENANT_c031G08691 [Penicillium antarcticum]|uniref:Uncharacterized protein n=1 Tax=Penicillium antarcticum TaxID=416450 RepID=A0A1V6PVS6_9EURO|nr:hypothetical protein PENANT_c031G08691 [Penicillium antarcticum]